MSKKIILMLGMVLLVGLGVASAREYINNYVYFNGESTVMVTLGSNDSSVKNDSLFVQRGGYIVPSYESGEYRKTYYFSDNQIRQVVLIDPRQVSENHWEYTFIPPLRIINGTIK